jgi:hypothetical protein
MTLEKLMLLLTYKANRSGSYVSARINGSNQTNEREVS